MNNGPCVLCLFNYCCLFNRIIAYGSNSIILRRKWCNAVKLGRIVDELIKIDVENYELEVLKGAAEIINKSRPLIYAELWDNENRIACIHFLTKLNYEIKVLEKDMLNDFTDQNAINFFFIPN